jgi:hypothetical protein
MRPICSFDMHWSALSIGSPGIVGISAGEIFSVHIIYVFVRPLDFKPPITITITITVHTCLHYHYKQLRSTSLTLTYYPLPTSVPYCRLASRTANARPPSL